ncbi:uncharacterized protein LOC125772715 [Anopheles funestus]|uniref:uncharacterized protein LOC125772715 n=1 Tax=Anopheles funestus TaxID=62324 RepID=UPI0020C6E487|nr:uncharacterized protein LOC125772715 [Anopheles funestus]
MEKKLKSVQIKKRQAVELVKNIEKFTSEYTEDQVSEISVCLEQLEKYYEDFLQANAKVSELDEDAADTYVMERCDMDTRYRRVKGFLLRRQPSGVISDSLLIANSTLNSSGRSSAVNLRLPKIELPTFDGDSTKWLTFRDRFVAMIDSSADIPNIMKLQYLLSSLKGDAGLLFEHTTLTADNYDVTWSALLKRYDNPRTLAREYYRNIHHLPTVSRESVDELAHLVDEFTRHVNGLRKLDEPVDHWDTPLCNLLLMKLDPVTILAWENHSTSHLKDKYKELVDFLHDRIRILKSTREFSHNVEGKMKMVAGHKRSSEQRPRVVGNTATAQRASPNVPAPQPSCSLGCADPHHLRNCPAFASKDVHQRREMATRERLCWNCLNRNHQVKDCRSSYKCTTCKARHHSLLHVNPVVTMAAQSEEEMVLLETVRLQLVDDYGNRFDARALLDSGSMCNFVSETMAHRLLTPRSQVDIAISGIGQSKQHVKGAITATVQSRDNDFSAAMEFLLLKTPSAEIPTSPINIESWNIPNVRLADPTFHVPGKVDIVIGGDTFWELHTGRKQSLGTGKPWLIETPFGWAVSGNTSKGTGPSLKLCHMAANECAIEALLQRFWETESILEGPAMSVEEDLCEKHYVSTTTRNAQGRYVVSLPRSNKPERVLGLSRDIADRRLLGVERRLKGNPEMEKEYKRFMAEYEQLGHMIKLTENVDDSKAHCYIPHHAVIKESSSSTKVRVVFDASCKTTSGYALNDTLLIGPTVQDDLLTIILRFRKHAVALVADVEKMYRQILHCAKDRKLLRIRYREHVTDPISTYELQTVTYGTASAPFLATRTLQQIAHDHKNEYPKAVDPVLHDFYVDDLVTGATDVAEAIDIRNQVSAMLESAGFPLKKWASNIPEALEGVPIEDLAVKPLLDWEEDQEVSTLGLVWEPCNDMFRFRVDLPPPAEELTRSLVLSYTARIFDPIGLLGPTVILAKMFLQRLWRVKQDGKPIDWNRALPEALQEEWRVFHSTLYSLRKLRVPRFVAQPNHEILQLHLFADASQGAYGACCYVRAESSRGTTVRLLAAKSKVVSLANTHSIARLELCAARLAVQLFQKVIRALNISSTVICWTDSMTVMHWLRSSPRRWKPFVANRVAQIQEETRISCWRHVPGSDNPADDLSRGLNPEELLQCGRWWQGPSWLSYGQEEWPQAPTGVKEHEADIEERLAVSKVVATSTTGDFSNALFARYSAYSKLRRVMGYCLRFLGNLRASKASPVERVKRKVDMKTLLCSAPSLTAAELQEAELRLCQLAQQDSFGDELDHLKRGKQVNSSSKLKWLSPYLDPKGMLRVGGRLGNANIPESTKHPIVLAASHRLSTLLAENIHLQKMHAGPQLMLATLRQKIWLIGGRNLVKSVYHRCHTCFRNKPTLVKQAVADLPASRVVPTQPFAVSGVDYCGPFLLKSTVRNRSPTKAYIAIFIVQKHMQEIWARWYPEYLQQLQARAKHANNEPVKLEINQLVVVKEDNVPPAVWPKARITALHPGKDGVVRVITLRGKLGKEFVRAANRVALLPNPND